MVSDDLYTVRPTEDGKRLTYTDIEFRPWPKIARLNRDIIVTEKIDGTNAAVGVTEDGRVYAQSRTRIITPESDNFGFARWVHDHASELNAQLGKGLHFGEWWGNGIQRGYGLPKDVKRFSLFNVSRFGYLNDPEFIEAHPEALCSAVPVLYEGPFYQSRINDCLAYLKESGSVAEPGFMKPEGIVVFHVASGTLFKATIENDEQPKGAAQ